MLISVRFVQIICTIHTCKIPNYCLLFSEFEENPTATVKYICLCKCQSVDWRMSCDKRVRNECKLTNCATKNRNSCRFLLPDLFFLLCSAMFWHFPTNFSVVTLPFSNVTRLFAVTVCECVCVCLWSMCLPVYCSRKLSKLLSGSQFDLICLCHRSNSNNNNRKSNYSWNKCKKELLYSSLF